MSRCARGTKRKAEAAAPAAPAAAPEAPAAPAAAAAGSSAAQPLFAIYICRKTKVVEYDEHAFECLDYHGDEDDESVKKDLDAVATIFDGGYFYNPFKEGPQLTLDDVSVLAELCDAADPNSWMYNDENAGDKMLTVFDSLEAANTKAAEAAKAEAEFVPEECALLSFKAEQAAGDITAAKASKKSRSGGKGQSSVGSATAGAVAGAAAAAAAAAAPTAVSRAMQDVGGDRGRWQVQQVMKVDIWSEVDCIAVSNITVEVVPVQLDL